MQVVFWPDWSSDDLVRKARFVRSLGRVLEETGFVTLVDPPFKPEDLRRACATLDRVSVEVVGQP